MLRMLTAVRSALIGCGDMVVDFRVLFRLRCRFSPLPGFLLRLRLSFGLLLDD